MFLPPAVPESVFWVGSLFWFSESIAERFMGVPSSWVFELLKSSTDAQERQLLLQRQRHPAHGGGVAIHVVPGILRFAFSTVALGQYVGVAAGQHQAIEARQRKAKKGKDKARSGKAGKRAPPGKR